MARWPVHWKQFCPTQQLSDAKDAKSSSHWTACRAEHGATQAKAVGVLCVHTATAWATIPDLFSCLVNSNHEVSGTVRARPPSPTVDISNVCLCSAPPDRLAGTVRSTSQVMGCPAQPCLLPVPLVVSPQPASSTNSLPSPPPGNSLTKDLS